MENYTADFWIALDTLILSSSIIIDRPKGSAHPRYPDLIYPLDYGYLEDTNSMDGGGIDVWQGSEEGQNLDAIIVTVDLVKRDVEIKLLLRCAQEEKERILKFHNESEYMKAILIHRE